MKIANNESAGPIWGVAAGLILATVGLAMGVFPRLLRSTGTLNEFVASGVTIIGIFLVVYAVHELRRKPQR
ncbi:hypothetical protein ABEG10_31060 [Burkholderia cenocepacia]|uniref:hypothetical protein n=1 Tax=Burkholderia cenocepacia TaxID=95486 RepID=UPI00209F9501|nr:hypothetical protein [Burkholderia cenocepacia]MCO8327676.1 hypothetical protein [Burkholderia cenocepacia]MCO8334963.1 hypothetical protein [Burkholderia cenocepacia]MCO8342245.1 hypothetical protein [Burkholderia cenocepacia]MCO8349532.1 hypothetical protein [Burkholderia cenocepacia]MCO8362816.1 hypothetical protein [Burkholderia cenocepacia]